MRAKSQPEKIEKMKRDTSFSCAAYAHTREVVGLVSERYFQTILNHMWNVMHSGSLVRPLLNFA